MASLSREQREKTRFKAARLFKKNIPQAAIARKLKVTPAAVNYWHIAWEKHGKEGLKSKGHPGFESRLTDVKRSVFKRAVLKGPLDYGFETNFWTLSRLAAVMKKTTGIKFGHDRTWQIVRELGFTCQKPQVRAAQRDEAAIKAWKEKRLPDLKKMGHRHSSSWPY